MISLHGSVWAEGAAVEPVRSVVKTKKTRVEQTLYKIDKNHILYTNYARIALISYQVV